MSVLVHKSVCGTATHILIKAGKIKWVGDDDGSSYLVGFPKCARSLEPLLKLYDRQLFDVVPKNIRRSFEVCGTTNVEWRYTMPKPMFLDRVKTLISQLTDIDALFTAIEYPDFFIETSRVFDFLRPSSIDPILVRSFLERGDCRSLSTILKLSKDNILPRPSYDRVSTKTGRLTIKAGPQILTLKKEFRSVFRSQYENGSLYEIDFISLEPRVALNVAGVNASDDVYLSFIESSGVVVSRDTAKLAVLCALYGAGKSRLSKLLSDDGSNVTAQYLLNEVAEYFKIEDLRGFLYENARNDSMVNCFGRPIPLDSARDGVLINNFLQSSASDVALKGFLDFSEKFKNICSPLFLIHDALVIDMDRRYIPQVEEYVSKGYSLAGLGNFPLKLSEF